MKVIIFFTYGISLSDWNNTGLLEREVRLYNHLYKTYGVKFVFVTFGDESDLNILDSSSPIKIVPLYKYFKKSSNSYLNMLNSLTYGFRLKKLVDIDNNILKTNQLWGAWIPLLIKIINKNKLIIRTGFNLLGFKRNEGVPKIKLIFYKLLTKFSLKISDKFFVTSSHDLHDIKKEFSFKEDKIVLIENWVEKNSPYNNKREGSKLVSVGRLENQKNYEYLIQSFSNSNKEIDIIGEGSKKKELAKLAKNLNTNVNFLGKIDNNELISKLLNYKFFISSTLYEGNPKAILEAMSAGCVVIAPNVPGVSEIIKHNHTGILYNFEDENLKLLIDGIDSDKFSYISKNAQEYINEKHLLEVVAKKEYEIYKLLS